MTWLGRRWLALVPLLVPAPLLGQDPATESPAA